MENKGFWIGGIVLALIVGVVIGVIWQSNRAKKEEKTPKKTDTNSKGEGKEIPLKPAVQPQEPSKGEPIKTA